MPPGTRDRPSWHRNHNIRCRSGGYRKRVGCSAASHGRHGPIYDRNVRYGKLCDRLGERNHNRKRSRDWRRRPRNHSLQSRRPVHRDKIGLGGCRILGGDIHRDQVGPHSKRDWIAAVHHSCRIGLIHCWRQRQRGH